MTDKRIQELKKLFSDQNFLLELLKKQTTQDAKAFLEEKGVKLSDSEMEYLKETLYESLKSKGELNEKELEQVSGGKRGIRDMTFGEAAGAVAVAAVLAAPVALTAGGGYLIYDSTKRDSGAATASEAIAGAAALYGAYKTGSWILQGIAGAALLH